MESGLAFRGVLVRLGWVGCLAVAAAQYANGHVEKGDIAGISGGSASNSVEFPTHRIEVLSHLSLADIGGDGEAMTAGDGPILKRGGNMRCSGERMESRSSI